WCHHGWGACPRCYDGRPGLQDGRIYGPHRQPLFQLPSLLLPEDVSYARLQDRTSLLGTFDRQRRLLERSTEVEQYDRRQQNAISLLAEGRTRGAMFDVANADSQTLDRYGR